MRKLPDLRQKALRHRCDGDHGVEECADKLQELYYAMRADGPIEKALEDWGTEITGINTLLGCCELLAGLAEEAAELAQAALKMRRTLDKSNPTPMTTGDASRNLNEEFADVLLCAAVLGFDREEIARIVREKAARWSTRLEEGCDNV